MPQVNQLLNSRSYATIPPHVALVLTHVTAILSHDGRDGAATYYKFLAWSLTNYKV